MKLGAFDFDPKNLSFGLEGAFEAANISFATASSEKDVRYVLPSTARFVREANTVILESTGLSFPVITGEGGIEPNYVPALPAPRPAPDPSLYGHVALEDEGEGFSVRMRFRVPGGVRCNILHLSGLPKSTEVIVPAEGGVHLSDLPEGATIVYEYPLPFQWAHQFAILLFGNKGFWISCEDFPVRMKRLLISSRAGDRRIGLSFITEADAPHKLEEYTSPPIRLEAFEGDWRIPAARYKTMLAKRFNLAPYQERTDFPAWAKEICLWVELRGMSWGGVAIHTFAQMEQRVDEIAELIEPKKALLYLSGWDDWYDGQNPEYLPCEELGGADAFRRLVEHAHRRGFKICPYVNAIALNLYHPLWDKFKSRSLLAADGSQAGWAADYDGDGVLQPKTGYISPDCPEWRQILVSAARRLAVEFGCDAVFFDQLCHFYNSPNEDMSRGIALLLKELRAAVPKDFLITAEGIAETFFGDVANCMDFGHGRPWANPNQDPAEYYGFMRGVRPHPIVRFLHGDYIRVFGHVCLGQPDEEIFRFRNAYNEKMGIFPTLYAPAFPTKISNFPQMLAIIERAKAVSATGGRVGSSPE